MFVDRDDDGKITGCYRAAQYEGQENIADDAAELLEFIALKLVTPADAALRPTGGDDAPAIQAAIDSGLCRLGPGYFIVSDTLRIADATRLTGCGKHASILVLPAGKTGIEIKVPTDGYSTILEDFGMRYAAFQPGISAIVVSAAAKEHTGFEARGLIIDNAGTGIHFVNASYWRLSGTLIRNSSNAGVVVRNTNHADSGDSVISDCWFFNPFITSGNTIGILQGSSGGLKIVGTKINCFNQAYQLSLEANAHTCDLLMTGCSVESVGFTNPYAPILLQNPTGTGTFHSVMIVGNQFNGWNYGYANVPGDPVINAAGNNPVWCRNILAQSNVIL